MIDRQVRLLLSAIASTWRFHLAAIVIITTIAVLIVRSAPVLYSAHISLAPATGAEVGQLGGSLASLGAIAGLTGSSTSSPFELIVPQLYSYAVADEMERRHQVLKQLYNNRWDQQAGEWRDVSPSLPARVVSAIRAAFNRKDQFQPNVHELQKFIEENVVAEQDRATGILTLTMESENREFAVEFLSNLFEVVDDVIRNRELSLYESRLEFLESMLESETLNQQRELLYQLASSQLADQVAAEIDKDYSAQIIEPAYAGYRPTSPSVGFSLFATATLIFLAGFLRLFVFLMVEPDERNAAES